MKRRNFLQSTGTIAGWSLLWPGLSVRALAKPSVFSAINDASDRVLILVQLNGGNDGLNTLIPLDQYSNLANVRSNILIPEPKILKGTDTIGLHPALEGMQFLLEEGKLGIVQNVGYPNQNRSHFRSIEIWNTASDVDTYLKSGWIGRYLDGQFPGFPEAYPSVEQPDPFAISMGYQTSDTCQGPSANFAMSLTDPFSLKPLPESEKSDLNTSLYEQELSYLHQTIAQTNQYAERITEVATAGNNEAEYPDTELGQQLKHVARLISGGLQTKIYTVNLGGFDTHAVQVVDGDPTIGHHTDLLKTLSDAIYAFQSDLEAMNLEEKVLGMTFSEFGRQIQSNGGFGTDHGDAAPMMLFGACANPTVLGDNPIIEEELEPQQAVPMEFDFRDVYASVLLDWFELPREDIEQIIYPDFRYIPIIGVCAALPAELTYFTGTSKDCQGKLQWSTGSELNTSHFIVQRSRDAKVFEAIGEVNASGGISSSQQYEFKTGTLRNSTYFRLKIVDQDGRTTFSPIIQLQADCSIQQQRIYPSPGNDIIYYEVYVNHAGTGHLEVLDHSGRQVKQISVSVKNEQNRFSLGINDLAGGVYTVRLRLEKEIVGMVKFTKI